MAQVDLDSLPDDAEPVYLARRLDNAQKIEEILTGLGIDYAVSVQPYQASALGIFFGSYMGAYFLVASESAPKAREALREARLGKGVIEQGG